MHLPLTVTVCLPGRKFKFLHTIFLEPILKKYIYVTNLINAVTIHNYCKLLLSYVYAYLLWGLNYITALYYYL